MELFRDSSEEEYMNELEKLKSSELGTEVVDPVIKTVAEWLSTKAQIKAMEKKLEEVTEVGKETVWGYNHALYKLLLREIHKSGKMYCTYSSHVVSEVSLELIFNENDNYQYYIEHICSECLANIRAKKSHSRCTVHRMKEEDGVRTWLKDETWQPLPTKLTDKTHKEHTSWFVNETLAEYGLPGKMDWTYHGYVFPPKLS